MLVEGIDDTPGPAPGCEPAVAAVDAVQSFSDSALNQADVTAGGNLTVSGVSFAASNVAVSVGALPAVDVTPSGPADGPQTWTASVPMSAVAGLADGTVTVGMQATRGGGTIAGVSKTLSKDVVAPAAPTATPTATSFTGSTQVALSAAAGDTIRYNLGDGNQAAPTAATGQVYAGPFTLNLTATVKAIAVDAAGNVSGVMSRTFTRSVPAPPVVTPPPSGGSAAVIPLAPSIGKAKSGKRGGNDTATAKWRAPVANGAVLSGYEVRALKLRPGRSAKIRPSVAVGSAVSKLRMSLPAGKYKFRVRAVSAAGKSPWSERSATVRSR
jgi:hypothetical protein